MLPFSWNEWGVWGELLHIKTYSAQLSCSWGWAWQWDFFEVKKSLPGVKITMKVVVGILTLCFLIWESHPKICDKVTYKSKVGEPKTCEWIKYQPSSTKGMCSDSLTPCNQQLLPAQTKMVTNGSKNDPMVWKRVCSKVVGCSNELVLNMFYYSQKKKRKKIITEIVVT